MEWGRLMENAVLLELMRMRNSNPLIEIFYLKLMDREVDFVVKEGSDVKQLVQVTYASSRDEIERREIRALLKLASCSTAIICSASRGITKRWRRSIAER